MAVGSVSAGHLPDYLFVANAAMGVVGLCCAFYLGSAATVFAVGSVLFAGTLIWLAVRGRELFVTVSAEQKPRALTASTGTSAGPRRLPALCSLEDILELLELRDRHQLDQCVERYCNGLRYEPSLESLLNHLAACIMRQPDRFVSGAEQFFEVYHQTDNASFLALALAKEGLDCSSEVAVLCFERFCGGGFSGEENWSFLLTQLPLSRCAPEVARLRQEIEYLQLWKERLFSKASSGLLGYRERLLRLLVRDCSKEYWDYSREHSDTFWHEIELRVACLCGERDASRYAQLFLENGHCNQSNYLRAALLCVIGRGRNIALSASLQESELRLLSKLEHMAAQLQPEVQKTVICTPTRDTVRALHDSFLQNQLHKLLAISKDAGRSLIAQLTLVDMAYQEDFFAEDAVEGLVYQAVRSHAPSFAVAAELLKAVSSHITIDRQLHTLLALAGCALGATLNQELEGSTPQELLIAWLKGLLRQKPEYRAQLCAWVQQILSQQPYVAEVIESYQERFLVHYMLPWLTDNSNLRIFSRALGALYAQNAEESRALAARILTSYSLDVDLLHLLVKDSVSFFSHIPLLQQFIDSNRLGAQAIIQLFRQLDSTNVNLRELNAALLWRIYDGSYAAEGEELNTLSEIFFAAPYRKVSAEQAHFCRWAKQEDVDSWEGVHEQLYNGCTQAEVLLESAFPLDELDPPDHQMIWAALPAFGHPYATIEDVRLSITSSKWRRYDDSSRRDSFFHSLTLPVRYITARELELPWQNLNLPDELKTILRRVFYVNKTDERLTQIIATIGASSDVQAMQCTLLVLEHMGYFARKGESLERMKDVISGIYNIVSERRLYDEDPLKVALELFASLEKRSHLPTIAFWGDWFADTVRQHLSGKWILNNMETLCLQSATEWMLQRPVLKESPDQASSSGTYERC